MTYMANIQTDAVQQMVVADSNDPRQLNLTFANLPKLNKYTAVVNIPLTLTKWWDWNINIVGEIAEQKITATAPIEVNKYAQFTSGMTFKLPKQFFVDVDYWGLTNVKVSNAMVKAQTEMSIAL